MWSKYAGDSKEKVARPHKSKLKLYTLTLYMQLYKGPVDVIRKTLAEDGIFGLYRGYPVVVATRKMFSRKKTHTTVVSSCCNVFLYPLCRTAGGTVVLCLVRVH